MEETAINLIKAWVEQIWNANNFETLNQFHPPTFQNEGQEASTADVEAWHGRMRATYPDLHYTIDDIFVSEDRAAVRWTAVGTHRGPLWGMIPPTEKKISWKGIHLLRIEDDKIVEIHAVADTIAQLQQMGVRLEPDSGE